MRAYVLETNETYTVIRCRRQRLAFSIVIVFFFPLEVCRCLTLTQRACRSCSEHRFVSPTPLWSRPSSTTITWLLNVTKINVIHFRMAEPRFNNPYFWPPPPSMPGQVSPLVTCSYYDVAAFHCHLFPCVNVSTAIQRESFTGLYRRLKAKRSNSTCAAGLCLLFLGSVYGAWMTFTHAVFCWAWPVDPFSWITWCSLTRSRSSWWLRRSDPCTCRLPQPHPSSLCWCPPRPRTAALSTACRCRSPSPSRCRATTRSRRAPGNRTLLSTLAPPPALGQVQSWFVKRKTRLYIGRVTQQSFLKAPSVSRPWTVVNLPPSRWKYGRQVVSEGQRTVGRLAHETAQRATGPDQPSLRYCSQVACWHGAKYTL